MLLQIYELFRQTMTKRVLNVGQCALDHSNISDFLNQNFSVQIDRSDSHDEAISMCEQNRYDLVLINRIYDADGHSGQATIDALCSSNSECPVMLVSNFADAQDTAVDAGAKRGFGKAELSKPQTLKIVADVLE